MKIGINASFARKTDTGIGRVAFAFLEQLKQIATEKNEYYLYFEEDPGIKLPKNFHKRVFLPTFWKRDDLIRKIWWEMIALPRRVARDRCKVFISLYQCPTVLPKNIEHKMLVHDMIWKVFPDYLDNWRKKFYAMLTHRGISKASNIFTISNWSKRDVHKYLKIPLNMISVAYPAADKIFLGQPDWERDHEILENYGIYGRYILYIGGFDFRKNVPALLDAFQILRAKNELSGAKLVLAGANKARLSPLFTDLRHEIETRDLSEHIFLPGFIKTEDLPVLYRHADLYVLPTLYEGFGLMIIEAMASGTPVAVSKSSCLPEIAGDAALYFNPYDSREMAKVISKILHSQKLRKTLSEKGLARAKKFSWEKFTEVIIK